MGQGLALQLGVHWTRYKGIPGNTPPPPVVYDFYVDSVNGSDANDGKSEATAFQTIGAVPWDDNLSVGLARGSYWREQLDLGGLGFTGVSLNVYGDGTLPTFDAADVFEGTWTLDSGNIWYADITTVDDQNTMYNSLWKDGVRMEWFASTGDLTTNNDYFVVDATVLNTYTSRFYIYSDTDPNTSGVVYEYASRHYGVTIGDNSVMRYIRTKRNLHNNGSTIIGDNSQAQFCIFEDGVKHNSYIGKNSSAFHCIAYKHDQPKRTNNTLFVGHSQTGTGAVTSFFNCVALAEPDKSEWANLNSTGITGFYAHTDGSNKWDEVQIFNCSVANCNQGFSASDATQISVGESWIHDCYGGISATCDQLYAADVKVTDDTHSVYRGVYMDNIENAVVQRMRMYLKHPTNHAMIYDVSAGGICIVQNSAFLLSDDATAGYNFFYRFLEDTRGVQLQNNIMYAYDRDCCAIRTPNTAANMWTPENYWGGTDIQDFDIGGVATFNFPAALAEPSYGYLLTDNICVDLGPSCVVDPANGNFATVAGSDAATLNAGIGPTDNVVYTPIPSFAEVDAM